MKDTDTEPTVCVQCGATHGTFIKSEATGWRWLCCSHLPKLGTQADRRKNATR